MAMTDQRDNSRNVVITGIGIVSPLGIGVDDFAGKLADGASGIGPIDLLDFSAAPSNMGGQVHEFTEKSARKQYLKAQRKSIKVMCREIQMGVASASLAIEHSAVDLEQIDHNRFGVDFGANLMLSPPMALKDACWKCVEENGAGRQFHYDKWGPDGLTSMEPLWLLRYLPNMPACHIGIAADARGPNNSITLDEASGNLAVGEAFRIIVRNRADIMIAGTTGTRLHPVKTIHAALWDELAESDGPPETWCRPFDLNRSGQVVAEGSGSFILEEESHAKNRGAKIFGALLGAGSSCVWDAAGKPNERLALVNAMRAALRDAGMAPEDIGHINAHGLGQHVSDRNEALAIQDVFGSYTEKLPVTAFKSYFGNAGSGCGPLELAGSLLGLERGVVLPTLNYTTPDPECPLAVVHGEPLPVDNKTFMSVNVTRVGQASVLIGTGA